MNLTPHVVHLMGVDGRVVAIPPEPQPARVEATVTERDRVWVDGVLVPVLEEHPTGVSGLPDPREGTLLVVSARVRDAVPERDDLVTPTRFRRDDAGAITVAEALASISRSGQSRSTD